MRSKIQVHAGLTEQQNKFFVNFSNCSLAVYSANIST